MASTKANAVRLARAIRRVQKEERARVLEERARVNASKLPDAIGFAIDVVETKHMIALNEKIIQLGDDMSAYRAKTAADCQRAKPDQVLKECSKASDALKIATEYHAFWYAWGKWRDENIGVLSGFGQKAKAEFYTWEAGYNSFLARFKDQGGKTHATTSATKSGGDFSFSSGIGTGALMMGALVIGGLYLLKK